MSLYRTMATVVSNAALQCFMCCGHEQAVEQIVELAVIWDTVALMWCHCNTICHSCCDWTLLIWIKRNICHRQCHLRCHCITLQWRHNGHDGVSNHQPHDCLLNRLFGRRSKRTLKLRVTGFCKGNFTVDRWIPGTKCQWRGKCFPLMPSSWHSLMCATFYQQRLAKPALASGHAWLITGT